MANNPTPHYHSASPEDPDFSNLIRHPRRVQTSTTMFSTEDVKSVFQLFPPLEKSEFLPSLILSSGGHGFQTLQFVQAQFRSRVTKDTQRIPVNSLAGDLDIDPALVLQLARQHAGLALVSADNKNIITIDERDALQERIVSLIAAGVVSKPNFATHNAIDIQSVDVLLASTKAELIVFNDSVYSKDYDQRVSKIVSELLARSIEDLKSVELPPEKFPGAPPQWLILHSLNHVLETQNLVESFLVKKSLSGLLCYPRQLLQHNRDAVVGDLKSGSLAYVDLSAFFKDFPELYPTFEDAQRYVQSEADTVTIDSFVVSKARIAQCVKDSVQALRQEGRVDLTHACVGFSESLRGHIINTIEPTILAILAQDHDTQAVRVGDFILTSSTQNSERHVLLDYADVDAGLQWAQLEQSPEQEVKYSLTDITKMIRSDQLILATLIKDKSMEKAMEDRFWAAVSAQEAQNETQFSQFWTERVVSRCQIYNDGLSSVQDSKLRDQLTELFTSYVEKELLLESISKARSQSLVLSRKTRKNLIKLDTSLKTTKGDVLNVLSTLEKFNKKQGIETPGTSNLEAAKQAMVSDMTRRMQRQKKSDGPVLFLTLVIILFAKSHAGVVYATGKFAPKLLKQLKAVLQAEQYEQVERWKEAAKTGTLTADDRADMKKMAEV